jgi:hypothetical protein
MGMMIRRRMTADWRRSRRPRAMSDGAAAAGAPAGPASRGGGASTVIAATGRVRATVLSQPSFCAMWLVTGG